MMNFDFFAVCVDVFPWHIIMILPQKWSFLVPLKWENSQMCLHQNHHEESHEIKHSDFNFLFYICFLNQACACKNTSFFDIKKKKKGWEYEQTANTLYGK